MRAERNNMQLRDRRIRVLLFKCFYTREQKWLRKPRFSNESRAINGSHSHIALQCKSIIYIMQFSFIAFKNIAVFSEFQSERRIVVEIFNLKTFSTAAFWTYLFKAVCLFWNYVKSSEEINNKSLISWVGQTKLSIQFTSIETLSVILFNSNQLNIMNSL